MESRFKEQTLPPQPTASAQGKCSFCQAGGVSISSAVELAAPLLYPYDHLAAESPMG